MWPTVCVIVTPTKIEMRLPLFSPSPEDPHAQSESILPYCRPLLARALALVPQAVGVGQGPTWMVGIGRGPQRSAHTVQVQAETPEAAAAWAMLAHHPAFLATKSGTLRLSQVHEDVDAIFHLLLEGAP